MKPGNIFLKGKDLSVTIGDFGTAAKNDNGCVAIEDVGTLLYNAPEIFDGHEYDERVDIWSFGCIVFQLCNNDVPFTSQNEKGLMHKITYMQHKRINRTVSKDIQDLYGMCMNKDYLTRPTASEIISLDFMQ